MGSFRPAGKYCNGQRHYFGEVYFPMLRWRNSETVEHVASPPVARPLPRKFLVFVVPRSDIASPLLNLMNRERNFDIAVRFYEAPGRNESFLGGAEFVMTGGLSKFHAASQFLDICRLEDTYEGYLFLDGDLEFDAAQLDHFLSFVHAAKLDIAQPSVSRDSYCYWKMAYHQPGYVFRDTSFVEVMAPYLSRSALLKALPTFTKSISTYGLDLVWPSLVGNNRIGIVDAFQIRHRDRVDHTSGNFYKYLKSINVDLDEEERLILAEYGVTPDVAHSRRGYFWKRRWPLSTEPPALVSIPLNAPEKKTAKQILIDLAMRRARWGSGRAEQELATAISPFLVGDRISSI